MVSSGYFGINADLDNYFKFPIFQNSPNSFCGFVAHDIADNFKMSFRPNTCYYIYRSQLDTNHNTISIFNDLPGGPQCACMMDYCLARGLKS